MGDARFRYDRNIRLFGAEGQASLRRTRTAVVGVGGLGSALVQHLALLGVGRVALIEPDVLDETSRNRLVGARATDASGTLKVEIAKRLIEETNPDVESSLVPHSLLTASAFQAIRDSDWVFGCLDDDGPRAVLNELASAYEIPSIDLASDVPEPDVYGGRVCVAIGGLGCLDCMDVLDRRAVRRYLESPEQRAREDEVYGVPRAALDKAGPSVSPVNGVVASLAATEFMVSVTGMRQARSHLEFRGWESKVVVCVDPPRQQCAICRAVYGRRELADVERYLLLKHLNRPPDSL